MIFINIFLQNIERKANFLLKEIYLKKSFEQQKSFQQLGVKKTEIEENIVFPHNLPPTCFEKKKPSIEAKKRMNATLALWRSQLFPLFAVPPVASQQSKGKQTTSLVGMQLDNFDEHSSVVGKPLHYEISFCSSKEKALPRVASNLGNLKQSMGLNSLPFGNQKMNNLSQKKGFFFKSSPLSDSKDKVVSITYEEIGLFPRSFSRVFDRFLKQIFLEVDTLVIQEYRFYRYLFLTTLKTIFILFFFPFLVNVLVKTYVIRPLTAYSWNTNQTEIFLNSYQQKRAFAELHDFEEKLYFESLIAREPSSISKIEPNFFSSDSSLKEDCFLSFESLASGANPATPATPGDSRIKKSSSSEASPWLSPEMGQRMPCLQTERKNAPGKIDFEKNDPEKNDPEKIIGKDNSSITITKPIKISETMRTNLSQNNLAVGLFSFSSGSLAKEAKYPVAALPPVTKQENKIDLKQKDEKIIKSTSFLWLRQLKDAKVFKLVSLVNGKVKTPVFDLPDLEKKESFVLPIPKVREQNLQEKTLELAVRYNDYSIEAITNFFADFVSFSTLFYLLKSFEIQINITKSFLLEVFFGLDDSKKSLLILLITDLLVGYHSPNIWELFFEFLFNHYGIPESQTVIFLLVATLPVLLDVLFKYLIFRHLNRSSPATVATYHAMIE